MNAKKSDNMHRAKRKARVHQHVMEDESYKILMRQMPPEWVVRPFNRPDYGIDLVIELFDGANQGFETLGEFLYVQVKLKTKCKISKRKIYSVSNVARGKWAEDKAEFQEIEVITYRLDTDTLYTVQTSGAGISVLLFLVDLELEKLYFVCLNDYIDKIILPQDPNYVDKKNVTIVIPELNCFSHASVAMAAMKFYGKRAKLLAGFTKIYFQKNEVGYLFGFKDYPVYTYRDELEKDKVRNDDKARATLLYFIEQLSFLDVWKLTQWSILGEERVQLENLKLDLNDHSKTLDELTDRVILTWHRLGNLSNMYEDICREWFLPKYIALLTSY
jgi:hypothetical protein